MLKLQSKVQSYRITQLFRVIKPLLDHMISLRNHFNTTFYIFLCAPSGLFS
jgi:hypothetical protein